MNPHLKNTGQNSCSSSSQQRLCVRICLENATRLHLAGEHLGQDMVTRAVGTWEVSSRLIYRHLYSLFLARPFCFAISGQGSAVGLAGPRGPGFFRFGARPLNVYFQQNPWRARLQTVGCRPAASAAAWPSTPHAAAPSAAFAGRTASCTPLLEALQQRVPQPLS